MEERNEIFNLLRRGCSLASELESSLANPTGDDHHPAILSHRCDEIIGVFVEARSRLNPQLPAPPPPEERRQGKGKEVAESSVRNVDAGNNQRQRPLGDGGRRTVSSPRRRNPRRPLRDMEDGGERRTVRVPVPQIGNTEVPPDDGFTWRKYGQKNILNASHPRSYYRCTHLKLYNCHAKKKVQRLEDNPSIFEIVYVGEHTCHMSATAPSIPPPPSHPIQSTMILPHHYHPISAVHPPPINWLPLDLPRPSGEDGSSVLLEPHHQQAFFRVGGSSTSAGAPAGPSTVGSHQPSRDGVDFLNQHHDHHQNPLPEFDLSEVMMFNSASSGSNSMENIFPTSDNKWDQARDKKD